MRTARAMASDGRLDTVRVARRRCEVQLGVERVLAQLGDHDPVEGDAELVEHVLEQVVGQRPGRLDPLERVVRWPWPPAPPM